MDTGLRQYQRQVHQRLKALTPVLAKATKGNFAATAKLTGPRDEFSELFESVNTMLRTIRGNMNESELALQDLHAANNTIVNEKSG